MDADLLTQERGRWPLWLQMLIGLGAGVLAGLLLRSGGFLALPEGLLQDVTDWIMLPARFFLGLITMVVIPLVFCSVLLAVTESGSASFLRRTGTGVALYFGVSTIVAVIIGVVISHVMQPAQYVPQSWFVAQIGDAPSLADAAEKLSGGKSIPQMIADVLPVNPARAVLEQQMLSLVVGALLAGLALLALPRKESQPVISVCIGVQAVCMKIVSWALKIAPIAVFGFLFSLTVQTGMDMLIAMGWYMAAVLAGLVVIMCCYMMVVAFGARRNPWHFLVSIRDVMVMAFSSSSSSASMPLTLATAEKNLGVRAEVARLIVPLGTIINMDGTAVYQVIVALFLTTLMGVQLSAMETFILCASIVGAAIGTPGTPGVGLVVLSVILANLGIPPEAIGVILSVDRLLDMCRTVINVVGDLVAAVLFDRLTPPLHGENMSALHGEILQEPKI